LGFESNGHIPSSEHVFQPQLLKTSGSCCYNSSQFISATSADAISPGIIMVGEQGPLINACNFYELDRFS